MDTAHNRMDLISISVVNYPFSIIVVWIPRKLSGGQHSGDNISCRDHIVAGILPPPSSLLVGVFYSYQLKKVPLTKVVATY